ncbi:type II toxin-antitoxin system Phd/YefM family antitoxin [Gloeocapsopsis sp. IPPAS B-1203]|uniref:type II toxin-antitoxin system Phd/YefM family antitoxin n=1 Tax=Gloeocapsopsis sp. IPPAS B-1203 TaxID=2049454 RepID=UPI000C17B98A|nr:type II toxin-antitoxin system Phd/YefM family antitoxin [Gloeocapsopsis sp. IPPAS B-1203]PIG94544.1 prevent-host-death protein [Gloeocapsopsis sp. IPPAS B-1203]
MPKRLTIAQAQQQLPTLADELTEEPIIIITQDGVPAIAALSYNHLTALLETLDILSDTEFVTQLRQSILQLEQGNRISWQSAKAQLGL